MRTYQLAVTLTLALFLPFSAQAQENEEAKEEATQAFQDGVALFDQGQYEEALEQFQIAYAYKAHPSILYNIAWCQSSLGLSLKALGSFNEYLSQNQDLPDDLRDEVEKEVKRLETLLCKMIITSDTEGVRVTLGKTTLGKTPLEGPFWTNPGKYEVVGEKEGFIPASSHHECTAGATTNVDLKMVQEPQDSLLVVQALDASVEDGPELTEGKVIVDGVEHDLPLVLHVKPGKHAVEVSVPGYDGQKETTSVSLGKKRTLVFRLEPHSDAIQLELSSNAESVQVSIDDTPYPPDTVKFKLNPGQHALAIQSDGHRPWKGDLQIDSPGILDVQLVNERKMKNITAVFSTIGTVCMIGLIVPAIYASDTSVNDPLGLRVGLIAGTAGLGFMATLSISIAVGASVKKSKVSLIPLSEVED